MNGYTSGGGTKGSMDTEELDLLRRAAKAAGVPVQDDTDGTLQARAILSVPYNCHGMMTAHEWNPLRDDGDALRLAVKVNLLVMPYPFDKAVRVVDSATAENTVISWGTPPDPCAATRRAIVQAAARMTYNV